MINMWTRVIFFSALIVALPLLAEAAGAPKTFKELANQTFTLLTSGIATLITLGIIIYLWGIASNMMKLSEGDTSAYRGYVMWGIVIIFVMVSIVGIVRLIGTTLFQSGGSPVQRQPAPASLLQSINLPIGSDRNSNV